MNLYVDQVADKGSREHRLPWTLFYPISSPFNPQIHEWKFHEIILCKKRKLSICTVLQNFTYLSNDWLFKSLDWFADHKVEGPVGYIIPFLYIPSLIVHLHSISPLIERILLSCHLPAWESDASRWIASLHNIQNYSLFIIPHVCKFVISFRNGPNIFSG